MSNIEEFTAASLLLRDMLYKDIDLKLAAVELSLLSVSRAIRYRPQIYGEDASKCADYVAVRLGDVNQLTQMVADSHPYAYAYDSSAGKEDMSVRYAAAIRRANARAKEVTDKAVLYAETGVMPKFFARLHEDNPKAAALSDNATADRMGDLMLSMLFQKIDVAEKFMGIALRFSKSMPALKADFKEAAKEVFAFIEETGNEEPAIRQFIKTTRDYAPR